MIELLPIPENELFRPCPFCGRTPKISGGDITTQMIWGMPTRDGGYYIECETEDCQLSFGHVGTQKEFDLEIGTFESIGDLLSAWNRRHDDAPQLT